MNGYKPSKLSNGYTLLTATTHRDGAPSEILLDEKGKTLVEKYCDADGRPRDGVAIIDFDAMRSVYAAGGRILGASALAEAKAYIHRTITGQMSREEAAVISEEAAKEISGLVAEACGGAAAVKAIAYPEGKDSSSLTEKETERAVETIKKKTSFFNDVLPAFIESHEKVVGMGVLLGLLTAVSAGAFLLDKTSTRLGRSMGYVEYMQYTLGEILDPSHVAAAVSDFVHVREGSETVGRMQRTTMTKDEVVARGYSNILWDGKGSRGDKS